MTGGMMCRQIQGNIEHNHTCPQSQDPEAGLSQEKQQLGCKEKESGQYPAICKEGKFTSQQQQNLINLPGGPISAKFICHL